MNKQECFDKSVILTFMILLDMEKNYKIKLGYLNKYEDMTQEFINIINYVIFNQ
jgi:hypothetical protein